MNKNIVILALIVIVIVLTFWWMNRIRVVPKTEQAPAREVSTSKITEKSESEEEGEDKQPESITSGEMSVLLDFDILEKRFRAEALDIIRGETAGQDVDPERVLAAIDSWLNEQTDMPEHVRSEFRESMRLELGLGRKQ